MSFSSNMHAVATRLLTTYGQEISVSRIVNTGFNPANGVTTESTTTYSGLGHTSTYSSVLVDGVLILNDDVKLLFVSDETPVQGDIFTVGVIDYKAIDIQQIKVQGSLIYCVVQLR